MSGHQNRLCRKAGEQANPGWQRVWRNAPTAIRVVGQNGVQIDELEGHYLGPTGAASHLTSLSISQVAAPIIQALDAMVSGSAAVSSLSNSRYSASGLIFLDLGR